MVLFVRKNVLYLYRCFVLQHKLKHDLFISIQCSHCLRPCGLMDKALEFGSRDAGSSPVMVIMLILCYLLIIISIELDIYNKSIILFTIQFNDHVA